MNIFNGYLHRISTGEYLFLFDQFIDHKHTKYGRLSVKGYGSLDFDDMYIKQVIMWEIKIARIVGFYPQP